MRLQTYGFYEFKTKKEHRLMTLFRLANVFLSIKTHSGVFCNTQVTKCQELFLFKIIFFSIYFKTYKKNKCLMDIKKSFKDDDKESILVIE